MAVAQCESIAWEDQIKSISLERIEKKAIAVVGPQFPFLFFLYMITHTRIPMLCIT